MPNFFEKHSTTLTTIATIIIAFAALVAIVHQRFDAQDKLISQRFDAQDRRTDNLDASMNQRFDAQDKRTDNLEANMNRRFDAQERRFDRLTDEVSELRKLTVSISERVSRNEGEIDVIREQIQAADKPSPPD